MNFGFSEEQELLRHTVRGFLADQTPMSRVREVMEGGLRWDADLWRALCELGWAGLALPEKFGGAGLGLIEQCILFEELGRSLAPVPLLSSSIVADAILRCGTPQQVSEWLPGLASGRLKGALAITEIAGRDEADALNCRVRPLQEGWSLSGKKLFVPDGGVADLWLVLVRGDSESFGWFIVPVGTDGVQNTEMHSLDPLRSLSCVEATRAELPVTALLGGQWRTWREVEESMDRARVMICAEMVGGAERCLENAVAYAKTRIQFGQPIGVNQAIKHKCADMLFAVESAKSITYYAAWAAEEGNAESALSASMAKAFVSDAFRQVAADNIQIHGGVGFTWEYDCHLYFKRAKLDETWLGDGVKLRERVAQLLAL